MSVDFNAFMRKSEELYDIWPSFFHWAGPALLGVLGTICWFVWWLRGHRIDGERNSLKEQINALRERLSLAKDQADGFKLGVENLKMEMLTFKEQVARGANVKELTESSGKVDETIGSVSTWLRVLTDTLAHII